MVSSDTMRGFNDLIILALLREKDSYGYEISKNIEAISSGSYVMKETTLYSAFSRLEKLGMIYSYSSDVTKGAKRTYYKITNMGSKHYMDKKIEWLEVKEIIELFIKETTQ